jgi:hypothetical protein
MTTSEKAEPKTCESCGNVFGCGAKLDGCWCADIQIAAQVAEELKSKYSDCLCPACLETLRIEPSMIVTYANGATEIIAEAVRIETDNYHEGMFDFYDSRGNLLRQISMSEDISWEIIGSNRSEKKI